MSAPHGSHAQRLRALSGALGDYLSTPGVDLSDAAGCAEEFTNLPEVLDLLACQPYDSTVAASRANETPTVIGVFPRPRGFALADGSRAPLPGQPVVLNLRRVGRADPDALAALLAFLAPVVGPAGEVALQARPDTARRVRTVLSAFLDAPVRIVGGGRGA